MTETGAAEGKPRPEQVAAYIAAMTGEMGRMAGEHNLGTLAYLLELVRLEAKEQALTGAEKDASRIV